MITGFEKIVEERIKRAQQNGDFDNLAGCGKPLILEDDSHIPEELRLGHKILKNAGCVPPEIELRQEIRRTEDLLASMTDTADKYRALKKLNFLVMKLNTMRRTSARFDVPQRFEARLTERFGGKDSG